MPHNVFGLCVRWQFKPQMLNLKTNIDMSKNDELKNETANGTKPVLPAVSRQYRPTAEQWRKVTTETAFFAEEVTPYSRVELIDFNKSKIHLKGGKRISFDCLSESEYICVCNGGYFEEANPIDEYARV